jgi:hypothetical protein
MREVVALLVVSSWQDLFEILTFQVLLASISTLHYSPNARARSSAR